MTRKPAVANRFYSGDPRKLKKEVEMYLVPGVERVKAFGVIAPHAGYM
jgi:AmmeMemoRadiSam system protein B